MPRQKISSWQQLVNAVLKPTAKGMTSAYATAIANHLYNEVYASIYEKYKPKNYERTYQFLNSIKIEKSKVFGDRYYQARILFDYKKIKPITTPKGRWNKHRSYTSDNFPKGQDFNRANLVDVLNSGTLGTASAWPRESANFIEKTKKWMEESGTSGGFKVSDVSQKTYNPNIEDENSADYVPVGIRIRKKR